MMPIYREDLCSHGRVTGIERICVPMEMEVLHRNWIELGSAVMGFGHRIHTRRRTGDWTVRARHI